MDQTPVDPSPPASRTAVFSVPAHLAFLDSVAAGILAETAGDPLKLADYTILVPNRETGFLLRQALVEQLDGKPVILPKIDAPGDINDDYLSLRVSGQDVLSQTLMDIPPPVSYLERQLILAGEIMKLPGMSSSVQKAVKLAAELGNFLDELQRNNIELRDVDGLVPEIFREKWSKTSEFLKIITDTWPAKLQAMGKVDPEEHKNALIQIQAAHWLQKPPQKPVIAIGFTDASPATVSLLQSVADMPQGRIVLQGVDLGLDDKSWQVLTAVHPQHAFKNILSDLGMTRKDVAVWHNEKGSPAREKLLREAMRPAGTAEGWSNLRAGKKAANDDNTISPDALKGVDLIVCGTPQEEASVIALKFRETLETPGKTAMLVTADRSLARRVSARLKLWKIDVPDGAGHSLANLPAGVFLLSTARLAADLWAPVPLLDALKHPLAALGGDKKEFRRKLAQFEDLILHAPRPAPGAEGAKGALTAAFNRAAKNPKQTKTPEQLQQEEAEMNAFVDMLEKAGGGFFKMMASDERKPFTDFIDAHIRFAEGLAATAEKKGAERIWRGDDGVKASRFLTRIRDAAKFVPPVTGRDYMDVLQGLMHDVTVQPTAMKHPSLKILTPEQAKLQKADVIIVGGVNDHSWPPEPKRNPWLSPDMIKGLGLPPADETSGRAAFHFVQMVSNPDVLITRATRSGDAPTVASPLLTRLMMVLKGAGLEGEITGKTRLLDIHTAVHTPDAVSPCDHPAPTPPVEHRPKELPVTAIEALMRDPYTVYAKYVLKLRRRSRLDASPNVAEKGTFTHAALETFLKKYPEELPKNAYEELLEIGRETFKTRINNPSVQSFWWPRFERIAKWFVKFEAERREMTRTLGTEVRGKLDIDLGDGNIFTLTTIADRVDLTDDDKFEIIDYKTGAVPMQKAVGLGFSPQLTLEALVAYTGGFKNIDGGDIGALQYWKLSGGRPAGEVTEIRGDIKTLMDEARQGIEKLMKAFNDAKTPYLPSPRKEWAPRYQDYGHLSRAGEWGMVKKTGPKKRKPPAKKEEPKKKPPKKGGPA